MRTAEEWINAYPPLLTEDKTLMEQMIKEIQKEAIETCAKKAYKLWQDYNDCDPEDHILSLINELK